MLYYIIWWFAAPYTLLFLYLLHTRKGFTMPLWAWILSSVSFMIYAFWFRTIWPSSVISIVCWFSLFWINYATYKKKGFSSFEAPVLALSNALFFSTVYQLPHYIFLQYQDIVTSLIYIPKTWIGLFFILSFQRLKDRRFLAPVPPLVALNIIIWLGLHMNIYFGVPAGHLYSLVRVPMMLIGVLYPLAVSRHTGGI